MMRRKWKLPNYLILPLWNIGHFPNIYPQKFCSQAYYYYLCIPQDDRTWAPVGATNLPGEHQEQGSPKHDQGEGYHQQITFKSQEIIEIEIGTFVDLDGLGGLLGGGGRKW